MCLGWRVCANRLLQSKRNNECFVCALGLAIFSTLDGSAKVELIVILRQKISFMNESVEYLSLFSSMIRTPGHFSPQILQVQNFIVIILEHWVLTNVPCDVEEQLGDYHQEIPHIDF